MESYIIPIAIFLIIFIIAELLKKKPVSKYEKIPFLLNQSELTFYNYLKEKISSHISIMCKVRLIDIVKPVSNGKAYIADKNRVISKQIDFVLIDSKTSEIKALIELNGSSHERLDRKGRDTFVNELIKDVNLKLFTIRVKSQYEPNDIIEILKFIKA